jgi:DNA-directed RNA polymerase subunit N (RpoN/RPB10)
MKTGHKTRLWCSQDEGKKQKQRKSEEEVKHRDHVGMKRYSCCSRLVVTSRAANVTGQRIVSIRIQHHEKHPPYYDVEMPAEALEIIRTNLEWSTPVSMVGRVQALFPNVTAKQIHAAWTRMSEVLWRRDKDQLKSAGLLLDELGDDVDVFEIEAVEGVEQVCWGMKKIAGRLKGKIIEIAIDATCQYFVLIRILASLIVHKHQTIQMPGT